MIESAGAGIGSQVSLILKAVLLKPCCISIFAPNSVLKGRYSWKQLPPPGEGRAETQSKLLAPNFIPLIKLDLGLLNVFLASKVRDDLGAAC